MKDPKPLPIYYQLISSTLPLIYIVILPTIVITYITIDITDNFTIKTHGNNLTVK